MGVKWILAPFDPRLALFEQRRVAVPAGEAFELPFVSSSEPLELLVFGENPAGTTLEIEGESGTQTAGRGPGGERTRHLRRLRGGRP